MGSFSITDPDAGGRFTYTLVSGTGDAARGIAYLRNSAGGRVSFVPETRAASVAGGAVPSGESADVPAGPGVLGYDPHPWIALRAFSGKVSAHGSGVLGVSDPPLKGVGLRRQVRH